LGRFFCNLSLRRGVYSPRCAPLATLSSLRGKRVEGVVDVDVNAPRPLSAEGEERVASEA